MRNESGELLEHCKALLVGSFVLGVLLAFALYATYWLWDDVKLTIHMEKTEAVVSNVAERWEDGPEGHSGGYVQDFTYTFLSPDGRMITGQASGGQHSPGSVVEVEYERDNPQNCRTGDDWRIPRNYSLPLVVLVVSLWIGGIAFIGCLGSIKGSVEALWGSHSPRSPRWTVIRILERTVTLFAVMHGDWIWQLWEWKNKRSPTPMPRVINRRVSTPLIAACGAEIVFGVTVGQYLTGSSSWIRGNAVDVMTLLGIGSYAGLHVAAIVKYRKERMDESSEDGGSDD